LLFGEIAFMSSFEPGIHRPHLRRRSSDPDFEFPGTENVARDLAREIHGRDALATLVLTISRDSEARVQIMRVNVLRRIAGPLDGRE